MLTALACTPGRGERIKPGSAKSAVVSGQADGQCQEVCFGQGTEEAQQLLTDLVGCLDQECGAMNDPDQFEECAQASCADQLEACFSSADCPLTGGGCPATMACYPVPGGSTDCFPSNGKAAGNDCNPDTADALECADGLLCLATESGANCRHLCEADADCPAGDSCVMPIFGDLPDLGACICVGDDCDGTAEEDIEDHSETVDAGFVEEEEATPLDATGEETNFAEPGGDGALSEDLPGDESALADLAADETATAETGGDTTAPVESNSHDVAETAAPGGGCQLGMSSYQGSSTALITLFLALIALAGSRGTVLIIYRSRVRS